MRKLISLLVMILLLLSAALAEVSTPTCTTVTLATRQRPRRISPRRCTRFSRTMRAKTIWKRRLDSCSRRSK